MAVERKLLAVAATPFTADGTQFGVVTVPDTRGFKVKSVAFIAATSQPVIQVQIQRVISKTKMIVGKPGTTVDKNQFINVSAYTVALGASISFPEQDKNKIKPDDIENAVYEADPTVAIRVIHVDPYGDFYTTENPLPVEFEGTVSIGAVEIKDQDGDILQVNPDGSINVNIVETPVSGHDEKSFYNEVSSVASNVLTQIISYTVPLAKTAILHRITTSGENVATYTVYLNGTPMDKQRTYYGGNMNALFEYMTGNSSGIALSPGDVLAVKVLHTRIYLGNFNARIQLLEIA